MFEILCALLVKHYVCDFPLQRVTYLYAHKGEYGHMGGVFHAMIHSYGTWLVLCLFDIAGANITSLGMLCIPILDGFLHYHIDYIKAHTTAKAGWAKLINKPPHESAHLKIYSQNYFDAIGLDQFAHHLTYMVLAGVIV